MRKSCFSVGPLYTYINQICLP